MKHVLAIGILGLAAAGATGCLARQTTHTIHLSPEGMVSWVVIEREVRSTEAAPDARAREEAEYLAAAQQVRHPIAGALSLLAPSVIRTLIYRAERPFLVFTEAQFDRIDWLATRVLDRWGLRGRSSLEPAGDERRWTLVVDVQVEPSQDAEATLMPLVADLESYRIVLTDGRFTAAAGFELLDENTGAAFVEPPDDQEAKELVFSLTWRPTAR